MFSIAAVVNKFSTNESGHFSLRQDYWHKFCVVPDWFLLTQLDNIQSPSDENLFTILFLWVFEWIFNPIYTVKGVSWGFLCRRCKALCSHFWLMALNLTNYK